MLSRNDKVIYLSIYPEHLYKTFTVVLNVHMLRNKCFFFTSLSCWCVSTQYSKSPVSQGDKILPHGASKFVREGKTKLRPEIRGQRSWGDAATFRFFLSSSTGAAAKNWVIAEGHCDDINVYTHTPTHAHKPEAKWRSGCNAPGNKQVPRDQSTRMAHVRVCVCVHVSAPLRRHPSRPP